MRSATKNVFRVVVSLVFIVLGLTSAVASLPSLLAGLASLEFHVAWGFAFDVIMFFAGLLGLLKLKRATCTVLAVILFIGFLIAAISSVLAVASLPTVVFSAAKAVIAWLFIGCVK